MTLKKFFPRRFLTLLCLIFIISVGFASKFYSGAAANWVNNSLGGFFYVIFWCLFFYLLFPEANPVSIAAWVLTITSLLEFLQLWHPRILEWIRSFFLGRTLIGTSFVWSDFLYYLLGAVVGWRWLCYLRKFEKITET